ncbi:MAG: hypothetical protein R3E10_01160 [Gemmatimonadota bacterium]
MRWNALVAGLGSCVLAACSSSTMPDAVLFDVGSSVALSSEGAAALWPRDPVQIVRTRLEGDVLHLDIEYGGGCAEHRFQLVAAGSFQESDPVQMQAFLAHDDGDDPCDALLTSSLRFSLEPIAVAFRSAYRASSGRVLLRIDGWAEAIDYRF